MSASLVGSEMCIRDRFWELQIPEVQRTADSKNSGVRSSGNSSGFRFRAPKFRSLKYLMRSTWQRARTH
eukprot:9130726-Alexandrium_andersonii.AAC.1